jgi:hypothetical protein
MIHAQCPICGTSRKADSDWARSESVEKDAHGITVVSMNQLTYLVQLARPDRKDF